MTFRLFQILLPVFACCISSAQASTVQLLLESNDDRAAGSEVFVATLDTFDDVLGANFSSGSFSQIDVGPNFSVGGLAYDGQYRLMLESNDDRSNGAEIFMATLDTLNDVLSANFNTSFSSFSQINVGSNFSVGGLAYDGQFRLMLESNDDQVNGSEVFMLTLDTFDDVLNFSFNASSSSFSQINVGPGFSIGGLAYDGQFRLLLERDNDRLAGSEVFMATLDTFDDVLDSNFSASSTGFSQIDVAPDFSIGGLAYRFAPDQTAIVPVPAGLPLYLSAFAAFWVFRHRK